MMPPQQRTRQKHDALHVTVGARPTVAKVHDRGGGRVEQMKVGSHPLSLAEIEGAFPDAVGAGMVVVARNRVDGHS